MKLIMTKNKFRKGTLVCLTGFSVWTRPTDSICCIKTGSNDKAAAVEVACPGGLYPAARSPAMVCSDTCDAIEGNRGFTISPTTTYEFLCCTSVDPILGGDQVVAPVACPPPCFLDRASVDAAFDASFALPTAEAEATYGPIKDWCFEEMSLDLLFIGKSFNQDISGWNVEKVTNMARMFENTSFNQDISGWNVEKVTDMNGMFAFTTSFNQDISGWNVEKVTSMFRMFISAFVFSQDLCDWGPRMLAPPIPNVASMFGGSSCPNKNNPNLGANPVQNLCKLTCP